MREATAEPPVKPTGFCMNGLEKAMEIIHLSESWMPLKANRWLRLEVIIDSMIILNYLGNLQPVTMMPTGFQV